MRVGLGKENGDLNLLSVIFIFEMWYLKVEEVWFVFMLASSHYLDVVENVDEYG